MNFVAKELPVGAEEWQGQRVDLGDRVSDVAGRKLLIVSDAWHPQINGVVNTLVRTKIELEKLGWSVTVISPQQFSTIPCPTYPEIRLSLTLPITIGRMIRKISPDYVHIATEGPLGLMARNWCLRHKRAFTTSYHTRFPEYLSARVPISPNYLYAWLRRFHNASSGCMVATNTLHNDLTSRGFTHLLDWGRGVDAELFHPDKQMNSSLPEDLPRPIQLYVGRVAIEKNIEAFLETNQPGTKVVVGGGPALEALKERYPGVVFTGPKKGEDLAATYADADVFVFPSKTDTYGIVLLEALASGLPVAAYPVMGPLDVITDEKVGALREDLDEAIEAALQLDSKDCRAFAETRSWQASTELFAENIVNALGKTEHRI